MRYCSAECQQNDLDQHSTLCSTFHNFHKRPSQHHYRSIHFPVNANAPHFVWIRMDGDHGNRQRGNHEARNADLAKYISGPRNDAIGIEKHHGLDRKYSNFMFVEHDGNAFDKKQPVNQCLSHMVGPHAVVWKGSYIAHGFKYLYSDEPSTYHEADREQTKNGDKFPLIALDLDTTSLGPLIAYFSWYARLDQGEGGAFYF